MPESRFSNALQKETEKLLLKSRRLRAQSAKLEAEILRVTRCIAENTGRPASETPLARPPTRK